MWLTHISHARQQHIYNISHARQSPEPEPKSRPKPMPKPELKSKPKPKPEPEPKPKGLSLCNDCYHTQAFLSSVVIAEPPRPPTCLSRRPQRKPEPEPELTSKRKHNPNPGPNSARLAVNKLPLKPPCVCLHLGALATPAPAASGAARGQQQADRGSVRRPCIPAPATSHPAFSPPAPLSLCRYE